jgi:cytoskeletal protein CcmA (bactofilin family)
VGIFGKPNDTKVETPTPRTSPPAAATPAPAPPAAHGSLVAAKALIKGELTGDEDLVVEGTVEGQIRLTRGLKVAEGGTVRATVQAQSIVVCGEVIGNCTATSRIEIQATGRLTGDIKAPRITIAEGAMFKGKSEMSGRAEARSEKATASS